MSAGDLCPAVLYDREEERVVCVLDSARASIPGAWSFICQRCFETMLERGDDREAVRQEWEV
jgi:hypothetical protein